MKICTFYHGVLALFLVGAVVVQANYDDEEESWITHTVCRECTACDFSSLTVDPDLAVNGKVADGTANGDALMYSCGLSVLSKGAPPSNPVSYITVLDSESPVRDTSNAKFDPDLGSPSRSCGGVGRGPGGRVGELWENCEGPLGNVLVLQDPRYDYPNDDVRGGCIRFKFPYPVTDVKLGLLDIDAEDVVIKIHGRDGSKDVYTVPKTGDNGYWTSDSPKNTDPALALIAATRRVKAVSVCFSGSGAVTHVNYCKDAEIELL